MDLLLQLFVFHFNSFGLNRGEHKGGLYFHVSGDRTWLPSRNEIKFIVYRMTEYEEQRRILLNCYKYVFHRSYESDDRSLNAGDNLCCERSVVCIHEFR